MHDDDLAHALLLCIASNEFLSDLGRSFLIFRYSALTATGFFFSRYALLVTPINLLLCSVNIALFTSSAYHLGRKVNADYLHIGKKSE